jgi:hypothetical protein
MEKIMAKLRWLPLGPSCGPNVPIIPKDLDEIAKQHGVTISVEEVIAKNLQKQGDVFREETMDSTLEEITQTVVTVSADDERCFRETILVLFKKYRSPRTTQSYWGSSEKGKDIILDVLDEYDGWS